MFKSATFKLTAWYLLLVMAISILFSTVLYNIGANEISRGIRDQSERIYQQFPVFDSNPILHPLRDIDNSDRDLFIRLVFLNIVVLVLAGAASYWLARRTLRPIEEAHEQQKRFTSDVSHELRTPLTALRMESEVALINTNSSAKELRATLASNLEEVSKLEKLVNNILRLSKLEADELKQNFGILSSQEVIGTAIKQVESQAKQRKINVKAEVQDVKFYGDKDSIVQMLVILLDNAIKYSHADSSVKVTAKRNGDRLVFNIIDQGVGIDREALEHIFDRFYRAESSRTKQGDREGYGLGLSIAKMIADVHDATINVRSQPNHGTTVEVELSAS